MIEDQIREGIHMLEDYFIGAIKRADEKDKEGLRAALSGVTFSKAMVRGVLAGNSPEQTISEISQACGLLMMFLEAEEES
jgi:hypothetical protein